MIPSIKKIFWPEIRDTVVSINPDFAAIVDALDPPYPLFKATFPYGCEFIKFGKLYLPNNRGQMVPLMDPDIPREFQDALGYNLGTNPVSMVLRNAAELFLSLDNSLLPFFCGFLNPGKLFSTSLVLNPTFSHQPAFLWNITAGARNMLMLPKISDTAGYRRLRKEFHLQVDKPKGLADHWELFREIANQENFPNSWSMEVLFFSKEWFDHLDDPFWLNFHRYLLKSSWITTEFWRNRFIWELIFSYIHLKNNIKPDLHIADTVKHLLSISVGAIPGIAPATDDLAGPIKEMQKVFKNIYNLDPYLPIIFQSKFFTLYTPCQPVYYSLQYPSTLELSSRLRDNNSVLSDLYDIKSLMDKYLSNLLSGNLNIENTPLADIPRRVKFSYFHSDNHGKYRDIQPTSDIPIEDIRFAAIDGMGAGEIPLQSTLIRGCIKISNLRGC